MASYDRPTGPGNSEINYLNIWSILVLLNYLQSLAWRGILAPSSLLPMPKLYEFGTTVRRGRVAYE